eukprot:Gb_34882 [translate_table: standard]
MGRAPCCDKANVKKGPWSPEEDAKLKAFIEQHGTCGNWIALPQKAGLRRCGKSCRLRWLNYLRPDIRHGGFSEEEDTIICSLYASIGSRWSIIAAQLPGRTDNDIKNYWNTRLKKKLLGKRKEQQTRRFKEESKNDAKGFYISEGMSASTINAIGSCIPGNEVLYGPDTVHHLNMTSPYANFGPPIVPLVFENGATILTNCSSSSSDPVRFVTHDPHESAGLEDIMSDNTCLKKLLLRIENALSDCSTNNNNASQISSSNISSHVYSPSSLDPGVAVQDSFHEIRSIHNNIVKAEPEGTAFEHNGSLAFNSASMALRQSCISSDRNYIQPVWLNQNGLNAAQDNYLGPHEFHMDQFNEVIYWNSLQQRGAELNYISPCRVSADDITTCWGVQLPSNCDPKPLSGCPNYSNVPPSDGNQQGLFQEAGIIY